MRLGVTGSRHYADWNAIRTGLDLAMDGSLEGPEDVTLIHGAAPGADTRCAYEAHERGWATEPYPADWDRHGKAAGPLRNQQMVDSGLDLLLAFPLPESYGTWDMVRRSRKAGIPVTVIWWPDGEPTLPRDGYTFLEASRCKGCPALIYWWETVAGKPSPHDRDGTSHFATCPRSGSFRR